MEKRSFKQFVEQELGEVPKFFIYAVLEWIMIFVLFIDGFLAFFATEYAKFFELPIPCLLCTRIDHVLVRRNTDFYYNDSICNHHKKNVSSLAFCHAHKKLSDIRNMSESCLLSFATEKESDCDTYKSLLGILHKDIELFVDEDHEVHLSLLAGKKDEEVLEKSNDYRCSCCVEPLKVKSSYSKGKNYSLSSQAPTPSPRAPANRNLDLSHIKYMELKLNLDESEVHEDIDRSRGITIEKPSATVPLLMDADDEDKTPNFIRGNKFFGISLSDSATSTPRWTRIPRKSLLEKTEFASESGEGQVPNEAEGDILHHLKRQVRMDRKSLMALYMDLDEERSASAVAAYNAMAMITRLQAEKAAIQMEALQYQRMMEEQLEYDQEDLQEMNNLLVKREEELKDLKAELEAYRQNYGCLKEVDFEGQGDESDEGYQVLKPPSYSSSNGRAECTSPTRSLNEGSNTGQKVQNHDQSDSMQDKIGGEAIDKSKKVSQGVRQLDRLKNLEKKLHISSDSVGVSSKSSSENDDNMEEETDNQGRS
ncbi:hypothetical protein CRYUN_Cryun13aG0043600 [Craigia yunnanensis]